MTMKSMPDCPICGNDLLIRPSQGRKSGKLFMMLVCPLDGRHFRGFITFQPYVEEVMRRVTRKERARSKQETGQAMSHEDQDSDPGLRRKALASHNVTLVSITEQVDYTTPQGRLMMQMLGSFAEFYSGSLSTHTKKGVGDRAWMGLHLGGIPFGYESCKAEGCEPAHPGSVHIIEGEAKAVRQLFERYGTGTTTAVMLAALMNYDGYRTRNMHRLGAESAEPRYFTNASIRGILHNPFYAGRIRHREQIHEGVHQGLISWDLFEQVQAIMKRNSGRSRTLEHRSDREYLLKGIIRCAHCEMPMWSQTYNNGNRYYREHRGSRGAGACINGGGSVRCEVVDEQIGQVIQRMILPTNWLEQVLQRINLWDEVARVRAERERLQERLKRLGKAYVDGLVDEPDYQRQKIQYEFDLASLVVPEADMVSEAGKLVQNLPELWSRAELTERRRLLLTILDAVYVDTNDAGAKLRIRPKAAFEAVIREAAVIVETAVGRVKNPTRRASL